jgi:hypothetical protein
MAQTSDSEELAYTALIADQDDGVYSSVPRPLGANTMIADSPPPQW